MKILLTGGTGFIGKPLTELLLNEGHTIFVLTRSSERAKQRFNDSLQEFPGKLSFFNSISEIDHSMQFEAIINLAGEGIANRLWSTANKHKIWNSRVQLTQDISHWVRECATPPQVIISGSATGYYGDQKDKDVYEETKGGSGFAHELCRHWEQAAFSTTRYGCRVCCLRIGVVLAGDGGFIKKMKPFSKAGIGALFGNGRQWFPWIHRDDLLQIILTALYDDAYFSTINAVSLVPNTLKEISVAVGSRYGRPYWVQIPRWLIQPFIGDMTHLFYDSVKASPDRLTGFGYQFRYPELQQALDAIFRRDQSPNQPTTKSLSG